MAATNPLRVNDLIRKLGWTFMPYASALGDKLVEAQVLFVDRNHANALDADDEEHGTSFTKPLATVDYAIGLCTADERSVILVAPGHYEDFDDTTTGFDADVAGIAIIGLGSGSLRPRFDFNDATSSCIIGANDVTLKNFVFRPSVATVAIGLDFEASKTGCTLEDIEFAMGEEGDETDEFVKAIHLTSGNHDTTFRNVKILAHASCDGATHGIHIDAASDRLTFDNVVIDGPYTNGISEDAAGLNHVVVNCSVDAATTNYGFDGSSTYAKYAGNIDAGVSEDEADPLTDVAAGTGAYPTGITNDSIIAKILSKDDPAAASSYDNTTDSLEALSEAIALVDTSTNLTTAVPTEPTARSLQDILEKDDAQGFDRTTDSLEAIRDHLDGTTILDGIQLDHLAKTADGSDNYPASVTTNSILGMIMSDNGNVTGFNKTTDSLEAISDKITAITDNVTAAIDSAPTGKSLQDILHKDDTFDFDNTTDSLEMLSDKLGAFSGDGGAAVDDSVIASLNLAHTDLDAILADTITISGGALPASPTASSLARYIASGGTSLGQPLPDSMSLVDLVGDYTGAHDGAEADDNIKAHLDLIKTEVDKIGTISNAGGTATIGAVFGAVANSSFVTRFGNIQTEVDKIGTVVNAGGVATIGGCFGDFANSSLVTRLGNIQTEADKIGTISNEGGTATIGGVFGAMANSTVATRFANIQTEVDKIGTISNEGGTATIGGALGDLANSTLVERLDIVTADTAAIDPGATRLVQKSLASVANGDNALFTVSAPVKARFWAVVTTVIEHKTVELKLTGTATEPAVAVDITAVLDCDQDAAGTVYKLNTSLGGALVAATNGVMADDGIEVFLPAGTVQMNSGAAATGQLTWYCQYEPLIAGAAVAAAS